MIKGSNWAKGNRPSARYALQDINSIHRTVSNLITVGTVTAVNKSDRTITASAFNGELSGLKAFVLGSGSGDVKRWATPVIGDTVLLINDNGNFNNCYSLPILLPSGFDSDISGEVVRAGDVTVLHDTENNVYTITHGSRKIELTEDSVSIEDGSGASLVMSGGECSIATLLSTINLQPSSCDIVVPGGVLSIGPGSLTFNGMQVHRS